MRMRSEVLPVRGMPVGHFPVQVQSSPVQSTVHILQVPEVKGNYTPLYCPGGRPVFYMVMGIIIQEVQGLTKKLYFSLLSRRETILFTCFYMVVACIII